MTTSAGAPEVRTGQNPPKDPAREAATVQAQMDLGALFCSLVSWAHTPGWAAIEAAIHCSFGGFEGLRTVELGCGQGKMSMLMASRGAFPTLIDCDAETLQRAHSLWGAVGLRARFLAADALRLPLRTDPAFDVAMSFGTAEHFVGDNRLAFLRAHLWAVRPGGLVFLWVPNRWGICYRLAHAIQKRMERWPEELVEIPFTRAELRHLTRAAGARTLRICCGDTFLADFLYHVMRNIRSAFRKVTRRPPLPAGNPILTWTTDHWSEVLASMRSPRSSTWLDEALAYPLLLLAERPRS